MPTSTRDDRYRENTRREYQRAEHYRDLLLAVVTLALRGADLADVDWADWLDQADLAEIARRRKALHTGPRSR